MCVYIYTWLCTIMSNVHVNVPYPLTFTMYILVLTKHSILYVCTKYMYIHVSTVEPVLTVNWVMQSPVYLSNQLRKSPIFVHYVTYSVYFHSVQNDCCIMVSLCSDHYIEYNSLQYKTVSTTCTQLREERRGRPLSVCKDNTSQRQSLQSVYERDDHKTLLEDCKHTLYHSISRQPSYIYIIHVRASWLCPKGGLL